MLHLINSILHHPEEASRKVLAERDFPLPVADNPEPESYDLDLMLVANSDASTGRDICGLPRRSYLALRPAGPAPCPRQPCEPLDRRSRLDWPWPASPQSAGPRFNRENGRPRGCRARPSLPGQLMTINAFQL